MSHQHCRYGVEVEYNAYFGNNLLFDNNYYCVMNENGNVVLSPKDIQVLPAF